MPKRNYLQMFTDELRRREYSRGTIKEYQREIMRFMTFISNKRITAVKKRDIDAFLSSLKCGSRAKNRTLSSLRSFFGYLKDAGIIGENPAKFVKMARIGNRRISFLTSLEYKTLIGVITEDDDGKDFLKMRNRCLMILLLVTGLRASEITNVRLKNIVFDERGANIDLMRKGGHIDRIYVNKRASILLKEYVERRREYSPESEYLFISNNQKKLDRTMVYKIVRDAMKRSGIRKEKMSPHVLRHTFATILIRNNVSLYKIKELLNHRSITTTEKYLHVVEDDLKDAVETIDI